MRTVLLLLLAFPPFSAPAQLVYSENFVVLLDSTRRFKGSFTPELRVQTQAALLVELTSLADLVFRWGEGTLTVAQLTEFTAVGGEAALDAGYFFLKWKNHQASDWMPEYTGEIQWADARGMPFKAAVGMNLRHAVFRDPRRGLFVGAGILYEIEHWNFSAVPPERLPADAAPVRRRSTKFNTYLSLKRWLGRRLFFDGSAYYQARLATLLRTPRLAASVALAWQFTDYLQLGIQHQALYDFAPVVPVDPWFHRFTAAFTLSF